MSQDAVSVATLIGTFMMFQALAGNIAEALAGFMQFCISSCQDADRLIYGDMKEVVFQALSVILRTVFPLALMAAGCAIIATFWQTKLLVSWELAKPKFNRLNPLEGVKRLFSLKSLVNVLKNIIKIIVLMTIIYFTLIGMFQESSKYLYVEIRAAAAHVFDNGISMVTRVIVAFIAIAAVDFLYQWWEYERGLRMSKQEIKEEFKQMEGDPQIKGKIKEMQRKRAMSRMMQQVPQADVVIRNPTHFAVALRYKPDSDNAPIVLAKGQDEVALRIVKIAEENRVAVIENVPLARSLYAETELNQEIPPQLYSAVAEVLVYVFHLNEKNELVK